jgi:D-alanine-D-alanine ligase
MAKINLGLICGGKSVEHEISLMSAVNVIAALDFTKYNLYLFAVTKNGSFRFYRDYKNFLNDVNDPKKISLKESDFLPVSWLSADARGQVKLLNQTDQFLRLDVVLPIMHGSFAEDGKMQGFLEMLNLPYVGSDVLASAICMDKAITKQLVSQAGIKIAKYLSFNLSSKDQINFYKIKKTLSLPVFVKPANAGSSVGVSRVTDEISFQKAIKQAFLVDHKILIEAAIVGRELECALLGNQENLIAGAVGEIVLSNKHNFYSYDAKYIDESGANLMIPAKLSLAKKKEVQALAKEIFIILQCEGMARVDFFMTEQGEIIFNELNTIPGFTQISMYPKLMMQETGRNYGQLIDELIHLAILRHQRNSAILFEEKMIK